EFPDDDLAKVFGEALQETIELLNDDESLFGTGLGSVDMVEHPARKLIQGRSVPRGSAALAPDVAARGEVPVGGVDDLAHGDPHQQLPELLATGWRVLTNELAVAKAGVHALKNVLFVLPATDAIIEMTPDQSLQAGGKPLPYHARGLFTLAAVRRLKVLYV